MKSPKPNTSASNQLKYPVVVYWDKEDKVYVSVVPDLPGCRAHGKTPLSALENAGKATDLWLETAHEFEDEVPMPLSSGFFTQPVE